MFGGADLEAVGMPRTRFPFSLADDHKGRRSLDGSDAAGIAIASLIHTDPMKADSDGDGLNDYDEVITYHTDPLKADSDGDGLSDGSDLWSCESLCI